MATLTAKKSNGRNISIDKASDSLAKQAQSMFANGMAILDQMQIPDVDQVIIFKMNDRQVLKLIDIDSLHVDECYQRENTHSKVLKIAAEFDIHALGIFHVCHRMKDGKYYVTDAQHRLLAIKMLRDSNRHYPRYVLCLVMLETNAKEEAGLFVKQNNVKTVTQNQKFRANLFGAKKPEVEINEIITKAGFMIEYSSPTGKKKRGLMDNTGIRALTKLYTAHAVFKPQLQQVMELLSLLFKRDEKMFPHEVRTGEFIYSFCLFLFNNSEGKVKNKVKYSTIEELAAYIFDEQINFHEIWKHSQQDLSALVCRQKHFEAFGEYLGARLYMDDKTYYEYRATMNGSAEIIQKANLN